MHLLRGIFAITLIVIWTICVFIPLFLMALICYLLPKSWVPAVHRHMEVWLFLWTGFNRLLIRILRIADIEVIWPDRDQVSPENWYLVICNHQSWTDILVLQTILWNQAPQVKFFTKQELIWIPFIGLGMAALGFPYVKRVTKAQIRKKPELKNADQKSIAKACERFQEHPSTVLNFLEGTRFTPSKHSRQNARYQHLLNPKIGGVSYVADNMRNHLHKVLDITIDYPGRTPNFWEFLEGRCNRIVVYVDTLEVPELPVAADGKTLRKQMASWVEERWQKKDQHLAERRGG